MTNVPEAPYGSVESYEQILSRHGGNDRHFLAPTIGVIEGIVGDLHSSPAYKVQQISNVLIARGRIAEVARLSAQVPAPVPSGAVADEPKCTPACDALQTDPTKVTGLDRSWHADDCPVPVMHLVLDGEHATVCGIAHADRPEAHGRTPDHEDVTCKTCLDRMPF